MKIGFTETVLRDANQSLIATRLPYEKFADILPVMDKAGYYSVECWGGAVFDCCLRYLDEDPWERLRKIRAAMPNSKLQMLLRGQNLLGYRHYPDEIVRKFVAKSVENGIDIIRIFDALNDLRNIEVATDEALKRGAQVSGTISYTQSPVHTLKAFAKLAKDMENMGVSTICVKDMAGVMSPAEAYDLVSAIKKSVKLPVVVHTHCTTGLAFMTYLKAAEAGADVIDTATSCFSGGSSQPATETLHYALTGLGNGFALTGERPLLAGGGIGCAPLYKLAKEFAAAGIRPHAVLGFRNAKEVYYAEEFARYCDVTVATDDGSLGVKGNAVSAAADIPHDVFYACGPQVMLRAAAGSLGRGQVSLEARMGCGFGACMGCSIVTTFPSNFSVMR